MKNKLLGKSEFFFSFFKNSCLCAALITGTKMVKPTFKEKERKKKNKN